MKAVYPVNTDAEGNEKGGAVIAMLNELGPCTFVKLRTRKYIVGNDETEDCTE